MIPDIEFKAKDSDGETRLHIFRKDGTWVLATYDSEGYLKRLICSENRA